MTKQKIFTCYMIWKIGHLILSCIFGNNQKEVFLKTKYSCEEVDLP